MADWDRKPQQQFGYSSYGQQEPEVDYVEAEIDRERARRASNALLRREQEKDRSQGKIPPVQQGFQTPGPTASERAYGSSSSNAAPVQLKSKTPQSQGQVIEMPEEYVGKPEVEMGPEYIGNEPGEKYRHEGPVCERPGAVGVCNLDPGYRSRLIDDLKSFVPGAEARYLTALQTARIDELLKKAPQLGLAAELLIGALGVLGGALLNGAAAMAIKELHTRAVWNGAMKPDALESTVAAQTNHMRSVIAEAAGIAKGRAKLAFTGATPQSQIKEAFIAKLMNDAGPVLHAVRNDVLDSGDDFALAVAAKLFSPDVFTVDACSHHVRSMLDRLEAQNIDEIGSHKVGAIDGALTKEVVQLQAFGQRRLALVNMFHRKKMGRSYGEDWYTQEGEEFVNWIDDDFGDFATATHESKNGALKTIDVSLTQDRFGPEVKAWIERTRKGAAR